MLILDINTIKASFFKVSLFVLLDQVFGKDKLYWFVPLYTQDDMKRMPALRGLDFTSRSEESEPLQSL